jgi:hypothetical protein
MSVADLERISYPPLSLRRGGGRSRRFRLALTARWRAGALDRQLAAEPLSAQGVALLELLLTDGPSSLYRPTELGALGSELRAAAAALEPPVRHLPACVGQEIPG